MSQSVFWFFAFHHYYVVNLEVFSTDIFSKIWYTKNDVHFLSFETRTNLEKFSSYHGDVFNSPRKANSKSQNVQLVLPLTGVVPFAILQEYHIYKNHDVVFYLSCNLKQSEGSMSLNRKRHNNFCFFKL